MTITRRSFLAGGLAAVATKGVTVPMNLGFEMNPGVCVPEMSLLAGYAGASTGDGNGDFVLGSCSDMWYSNGVLYVASPFEDGVVSVNVSNPASPVEMHYLSVGAGADADDPLNAAEGLFMVGSVLYVATDDGFSDGSLVSVDASSPGSMSVLDTLSYLDDGSLNPRFQSCTDVVVVGGYAYGAGNYVHHDVADVSSSSSMTFAEETWSGPVDRGVKMHWDGATLYMTKELTDGLATYSPSGGVLGSPLDFYAITDAWDVVVDGGYAFVTTGPGNSIVVLNVSNPSSITFVSTFTDVNLDRPLGLVVSGDYLFVCCSDDNGVMCIDKSDPANLERVQFIEDPDDGSNDYSLFDPRSILKVGQYLFVTGYRLSVIDTSCV